MTKVRNLMIALSTKQRIGIVLSVVVVATGAVLGVLLSGGRAPIALHATTTSTPPTTTTTVPGLSVPFGYCPLTDVKAPTSVPNRPALAVKVGNEPNGARPQSGLNEADIVFDTPAEGFIMRYVMVFQCENAGAIGPDRSVRWVDWHILRQFQHPVIAYAGGIGYNLNIVAGLKWASADNLLGNAGGAGIRTTNRTPPDNLYTSTSALYALSPAFNKEWGAPNPIFSYSASPSSASTPLASMRINFSYDTDAIWTWNKGLGKWVHSYSDGPDIDTLTGRPVVTDNVVVLVTKYRIGPYAEHIGGSGDFQSETLGTGSGYILRDGTMEKVTWARRFVTEPWTFTGPDHKVVSLAPGKTFVEIVPNSTAAAKGALTFVQ
ncbi:MAG TPA: DUF3048 domain-containing protein [Acidimicrobiales bacterium]|nr:DUF3048 domain-containing protein [Acidimicrobiales bacterium]